MSKQKKLPDGQTSLTGEKVQKTEKEEYDEELSNWKSALQKYVRRGMTEKAMYAALKVAEKNWYVAWRRLSIIAVEDCLSPQTITAIGELYRMFMASRRTSGDGKELSWDEKRLIVAAAKILSESEKDRSADEFLEMVTLLNSADFSNDVEVQKRKQELETIDDYVFDEHTLKGRKMGRGDRYWYEESRRVNKPSEKYIRFSDWVYTVKKRNGKLK